jgi:SAM-dependent methyltransferase
MPKIPSVGKIFFRPSWESRKYSKTSDILLLVKEYFGKSAQKYQQTQGKHHLLFPTFAKHTPSITSEIANLLDIGCGNGDLYQLAKEKNYNYFGLDISDEMIQRAKQDYPEGRFLVSSATDFASKYSQQFDLIIISMLFPSLREKKGIIKTLKESKKVLKENGRILIGLPHPCFDGYMQYGLFGRKDVKTDFRGYFQPHAEFKIEHALGEGSFTFEDCHWSLSDYVECIRDSNLSIDFIDECKPELSLQKTDKEFFAERNRFPTYMVILLK